MKTTLTRNQVIALSAVSAVAVTGLGAAIHSASVKNQICLSYERQITEEFDKGVNLMQELKGYADMMKENPFSAFGIIGQVGPLMNRANEMKTRTNDLKYAYTKTCGQERFDKLVESDTFKTKKAEINEANASIQSLQFGN